MHRIPLLRSLLLAVLVGTALPVAAAPGDVGTMALDFSLQEPDSTWHTLEQYRGQVVFLAMVGFA